MSYYRSQCLSGNIQLELEEKRILFIQKIFEDRVSVSLHLSSVGVYEKASGLSPTIVNSLPSGLRDVC